MFRLILDTWLILLVAFFLGSALAWFVFHTTKGARR